MQARDELLRTLAEIETLHVAAGGLAKQAYTMIAAGDDALDSTPASNDGHLRVDAVTYSIEWKGRRCVMGPSLLFRFFYRLAMHPSRLYTYDILMTQVWDGCCEDSTVRSAAKRLRRALRDAEMPELADAIRGRGRCYGLFLDDALA